MKDKHLRPGLSVIVGGESLVSHAGGTLLVETARRNCLAAELTRLLGPWRRPGARHDPGKIVLDLAIAVALGGDAAADIAVLRAQPGVFGWVASDPTVSRLITRLAEDPDAALAAITTARAVARERVWNWAGPPTQDEQMVIDLDATLITAHSARQRLPPVGGRGQTAVSTNWATTRSSLGLTEPRKSYLRPRVPRARTAGFGWLPVEHAVGPDRPWLSGDVVVGDDRVMTPSEEEIMRRREFLAAALVGLTVP